MIVEYFGSCSVIAESAVQFRDNRVSSQGQDSRESDPSSHGGSGGVHLSALQVDGGRWGTANPGDVQRACSGHEYVSLVAEEGIVLLF